MKHRTDSFYTVPFVPFTPKITQPTCLKFTSELTFSKSFNTLNCTGT